MPDAELKEEALSGAREALAGLEKIPGAALAGDQHDQLLEAVENTEALEKALANELDQLQERDRDE